MTIAIRHTTVSRRARAFKHLGLALMLAGGALFLTLPAQAAGPGGHGGTGGHGGGPGGHGAGFGGHGGWRGGGGVGWGPWVGFWGWPDYPYPYYPDYAYPYYYPPAAPATVIPQAPAAPAGRTAGLVVLLRQSQGLLSLRAILQHGVAPGPDDPSPMRERPSPFRPAGPWRHFSVAAPKGQRTKRGK